MPPVPHHPVGESELKPDVIHVLITAFGPFWKYTENPSWLAAKPLNNTIIYTETAPNEPNGPNVSSPGESYTEPMQEDRPPVLQQIHLTVIQIPVTYQDVLAITPGLHARPPILPLPNDPEFAPAHVPDNGYDFIFHLGVAGRGPLRMERLAHKTGYRMKDVDGQYAPIITLSKVEAAQPEVAEVKEIEVHKLLIGTIPIAAIDGPNNLRNVMDMPGVNVDRAIEGQHTHEPQHHPPRGFSGKLYDSFPEELYTEIDVTKLILHLKKTAGIEQVYSSMDAGHYLCDFLFYGSLAEAKRNAQALEKGKTRNTPPKMTPVLFMHLCPIGQPFEREELTDAIKQVVAWVCARLG